MRIKCPCGKWHNASTTALAVIIDAFQQGDLTRTGGEVLCFKEAFDPDRVMEFHRRYRNNIISFDMEGK